MKEKGNALWTTGILCGILLIFTIADLLGEDRLFSETENRLLAQRPKLSVRSVLAGEYSEAYEEYVTDQFVGRDAWISIKTRADMALQKKEVNGVYLGEENYLIEVHDPADYPASLEAERLTALQELTERWDARVMLIPSADNILTDKLPAFAMLYDQEAFLEKVKKEIGAERYVDVYSILKEHKDEYIYYRTDHHWTSLGAYYGMRAWERAMGKTTIGYSPESLETVSEDFLGTLHARINIEVPPDTICALPQMGRMQVTYDLGRRAESLYEESYLETKNQYGYFLDDNHGLVEIVTEAQNDKTLFVVKDSFANCMIPFLTARYEKIYMVDLRYYSGRLFEVMESCEPPEGMDVLVLYNCIHFLEDFKYY